MDYPMTGEYKKSSVRLCSDDLPEIKEWATGGEYVVVLHLKQTSSHLLGESDIEACFEVCNAKVAPVRYTKSVLEESKAGEA